MTAPLKQPDKISFINISANIKKEGKEAMSQYRGCFSCDFSYAQNHHIIPFMKRKRRKQCHLQAHLPFSKKQKHFSASKALGQSS
jgi:hypothetical protein